MRVLVDECAGPLVGRWLRDQGHEVISVFDEARGISDEEVLHKAVSENRILITVDKDFGEMIYRERREHYGVILLRLSDERALNKVRVISQLLDNHSQKLPKHFVTVTEDKVRIT